MDAIAFIKNHAGLFVLALAVLALPMAVVAISDDSDATAEPETVTIKFDCNGGEPIADMTVEKGKQFLATVLYSVETEKEGYKFIGWCTDKNLEDYNIDMNVLVNKDMTLYAKFIKNDEVVVQFIDSMSPLLEAHLIEYKVVKAGNAVAKPQDPVKSGYKFVGWYTSHYDAGTGAPVIEEYDFESIVNDDTQILAGWEKADTILGIDQATFALILVVCIALLAVVAVVMLLFINPVLAAIPAVAAIVFAVVGFLTNAFSYL